MSTIVDSIDSTIAARVRGERTARRWSLDDLAERASVSKAMISKIERAEASPTAVTTSPDADFEDADLRPCPFCAASTQTLVRAGPGS